MHINGLLLLLIGAYLIGSIPIGYLIARIYGINDIRRYGSHSIGATNVSRILGVHSFFIVLFGDVLKAYFYLRICSLFEVSSLVILLCAAALLIGNSHSIFLHGSGGKGVATFIGIMIAINPLFCVALIFTWLIAVAFLRVIGIASVITALMVPFYALLLTDLYGFLFMVAAATWIIWRHRSNIRLFYMMR